MSTVVPNDARKRFGLIAGPILFFAVLLLADSPTLPESGRYVAAITVLMTVWWISEAIPIPVTALLPIVLFPFFGVMTAREVTAPYANHLIYLFLGGFLIALAIERWHLHRRIALLTIRVTGTTPGRVLLGFMLASAGLSMWISNTATTMMMLPIGLAIVSRFGSAEESRPFAQTLMLGIAYAGSIGGVATLIGTPPNAILAGVYENTTGTTLGFADWMVFGIPLSATMFVLAWLILARNIRAMPNNIIPGGGELIGRELHDLGRITVPEKRVLMVFSAVAFAWITRGLLKPDFLKPIADSTIAIAGAIMLFLIPSGDKQGGRLLDWQDTGRLPWDIIILFGGGFALAAGFGDSGLTEWIARQLGFAASAGTGTLILLVAVVVIFLTEVTSNTATASLILPLMGALAAAANTDPLGLMVTAAVAASFAFMLPVATPPNAIVYSSRAIPITTMARTGFLLNLIACAVLYLFVVNLLPLIPGLHLSGH